MRCALLMSLLDCLFRGWDIFCYWLFFLPVRGLHEYCSLMKSTTHQKQPHSALSFSFHLARQGLRACAGSIDDEVSVCLDNLGPITRARGCLLTPGRQMPLARGDAGAQIVPLRAMICGLARLVEGCSAFPMSLAFPGAGCWWACGSISRAGMLKLSWQNGCHGGEWGASCIQQLFHDFAAHQMALVKGLEVSLTVRHVISIRKMLSSKLLA
jgi:hypothetical protein